MGSGGNPRRSRPRSVILPGFGRYDMATHRPPGRGREPTFFLDGRRSRAEGREEVSAVPERVESLAGVIEPVVASLGLELFDLEITGAGRARVLRVVVD